MTITISKARVFKAIALTMYWALMSSNVSFADECNDTLNKKTISIVVKTGPGGGYDLAARIIAKRLEKDRVGARVVVRNLPGGQGLIAANYLLEDNPNEIALGYFDLYSIDDSGVIDDRKVTAILGISEQNRVWIARQDFQLATAQQNGAVIANYISIENILSAGMVSDLLGIKSQYLSNQTDQSQVVGAILRNEADISSLSISGARRAVKSGDIGVILSITNQPNPDFPTAPYLGGKGGMLEEMMLGRNDLERSDKLRLADQIISLSNLTRAMHVRAGISEETKLCLENALSQSMNTQDVINDAKAADLAITIKSRAKINEAYNANKVIAAELRPLIEEKKKIMQGF